MSDGFDAIMGTGRGASGHTISGPEPKPFTDRVRQLADTAAAPGAGWDAVEHEAAFQELRVHPAWLVSAEGRVPVFFVSDGRQPPGRDPDALLVARMRERADAIDDADLDLIDRVLVFTYETQTRVAQ
jgi:hypothetical protein